VTTFTQRRAARVLLVDDAGRVLLFRGADPARPEDRYWFTPGGGLEPDEMPAAGATRELAEETGLMVSPAQLGESVWADVVEFQFDGWWYHQTQEFFLVRVPTWEVDTKGFTEVERGSVDEHRWWSVEELTRTGEPYFPAELPALLSRVLKGEAAC
jgi:ADP-ribose pyrophosphatase YjhB (NUDIX family)